MTVALEDDAGNVIATMVTDKDGKYLFPGLPAGTYTVVITDTENVLGSLVQTADPDGGLGRRSQTTIVAGGSDLEQDHGFAPPEQQPGLGLIGDTIFLDRNANNLPDPGEGIEAVAVELFNQAGALLGSTVTDENGNYWFGGLDPNGTYRVEVDVITLPLGLTNTVDPDGGLNSKSLVNLSLSSTGINLAQDFGYRPATTLLNRIEGTIWLDRDAGGTLDPDEGQRFQAVTVVLRDDSGNIVAQTVTDLGGNFSFASLPAGTYTVDVTDDANVLDGYWHSTGPTPGADNNSQVDPYTVSVAGGQIDRTADFGYYKEPGAIGNRVWLDPNSNGIQDSGEPGAPGAVLELTVTYPSGDVVTVTTLSGNGGSYAFRNLLLDEDHDGVGIAGVGGDEPQFDVAVVTPPPDAGSETLVNAGSDARLDSDDHAGTQAFTEKGAGSVELQTPPTKEPNYAGYDFGYKSVTLTGQIQGTVYIDANRNGLYQAGLDTPIPGITVTITPSGGGSPITVVTDANGFFSWTVPPGTYTVTVDQADPDFPSVTGLTTNTFGEGSNPTSGIVVPANGVGIDNTGYVQALNCRVTCDIDKDGDVDTTDLKAIMSGRGRLVTPPGAPYSGDCNASGRLEVDDAAACKAVMGKY